MRRQAAVKIRSHCGGGCADSTLSGLSRKPGGGDLGGGKQGAIDLFINKSFALPQHLPVS